MNRQRHLFRALMLVGCTIGAASSVAASHHHRETSHHRVQAQSKHAVKGSHADPSTPKGVTSVPPGGLKIYCAGRKSPLLVRKFTQGSGTTVTVLCR